MLNDYLEDAKENEEVFRNILRSKEIDERELTIEEIYKKYSCGSECGKGTILYFKRGPFDDLKISKDEAIFASKDITPGLLGWGTITKYRIKSDNSVEFDSNVSVWTDGLKILKNFL